MEFYGGALKCRYNQQIANIGTDMIRYLKSVVRDQLGLPAWLVLMAAGCAAHVTCNAILRKPVGSCWGLAGVIAVGVVIESYEIWDQYRSVGLSAPGNDPLAEILARHALDVLLMLAGPILIVVTGAVFGRSN